MSGISQIPCTLKAVFTRTQCLKSNNYNYGTCVMITQGIWFLPHAGIINVNNYSPFKANKNKCNSEPRILKNQIYFTYVIVYESLIQRCSVEEELMVNFGALLRILGIKRVIFGIFFHQVAHDGTAAGHEYSYGYSIPV